jgi:antitoxin component HigA of HigAB toxin-antitoxin module
MSVTANDRTALAGDTYMKLVRELPLRRINSAGVHAKAKRLVLRLSAGPTDRGAREYLDVLVDLIADYERRAGEAVDASKVSVEEIVRHRLQERGMSVSALSRLIDVPQPNLSEMLRHKRDWSKAAIRGLSSHLNIRAERFLD